MSPTDHDDDGEFSDPVYHAVSLDKHDDGLLRDHLTADAAPTTASAGPAAAPRPHRRLGARRSRRRLPRLVRRALISALAFTSLLSISAAATGLYAYHHYNAQITRVPVLKRSDTNIREAAKQINAENFLIIGSDTRAGADADGSDTTGARSDTTILVHLGAGGQRATIVSFPRDSWVNIPACPDGKGGMTQPTTDLFNSAFSEGGAACTILLVQSLTGIEVTHYVQVDFSGFKAIVNALGSVTICSPEAVSDPGSSLVLKAGNNTLNGDQALAYVRARENLGDGSDLQRIERQQRFLGVVLRQAEGGKLLSNPAKLTAFLDAATKAVTVDSGTTFSDLETLASSLQGLDPAKVVLYTAPIADRDYSPPGTNFTGKVLLDTVQGRLLYDSIIEDRPLVATPTPAATPKPGPTSSATSKSATPTPTPTASPTSSAPTGITAADTTCTL